eukprot:TRINITY_DN377_c3_g1_i3.p1 TRINITY_DN377_c3_g1~~TRINITY_DN377_c3_g1_i3.p1  ORF type:complete len:533 (-),score=310.84 TRINITY_DN377_c3_g1_i3:178-1776(-)
MGKNKAKASNPKPTATEAKQTTSTSTPKKTTPKANKIATPTPTPKATTTTTTTTTATPTTTTTTTTTPKTNSSTVLGQPSTVLGQPPKTEKQTVKNQPAKQQNKPSKQNKKQQLQEEEEEVEIITEAAKNAQTKKADPGFKFDFKFDESATQTTGSGEIRKIDTVPLSVQRRLKALKKLRMKRDEILKQQQEEQKQLNLKYQSLFQPLFEKRASIVNAAYEPKDEDLPTQQEEKEELEKISKNIGISFEELNSKNKPDVPTGDDIKGIPNFWFDIITSHKIFESQITERDEEALKYLIDVKAFEMPYEYISFEFHFKQNPFFTDSILKKTVHFLSEPSGEFAPVKSIASKINWQKGKKLTVITTKKQQKKKGKAAKTIVKEEPCESFFNIFRDNILPEDTEDDDYQEITYLLEDDLEIAFTVKDDIVAEAVSFYLGEVLPTDIYGDEDDFDDEDGEFDEDDEDDEDGEFEDEDDEEDDEDEEIPVAKSKSAKGKSVKPKSKSSKQASVESLFGAATKGSKQANADAPECKTQ